MKKKRGINTPDIAYVFSKESSWMDVGQRESQGASFDYVQSEEETGRPSVQC